MKVFIKLPFNTIISFGFILINKGFGLVYPLLLIPYLISTIGLANYGKIAFLQSLVIYAALIVDYGFNLYCIRLAVKHIKDEVFVTKIFFHVIAIKIFFSFIITSLIFIFLFVSGSGKRDYLFYLSSMLIVIGQSYLPIWLFQAKQENYKLAGSSLLSKAIATILILTFVKVSDDYLMIPLYLGIGEIAACIAFSLNLLLKINTVSFEVSYFKFLLFEAKDIFISNFSIASYTNLTTIIASIFFAPNIVGIYSIGEKVANLSRAFISIIIQFYYPKACEIVNNGDEPFKQFILKLIRYFLPAMFLISLTMVVFAGKIAAYFSSLETNLISDLIQIFAVLPLSIFCLNLIPYITLSAHSEDKLISSVIIYSSFIGLIFLVSLSLIFDVKGIAISVVLTEALVGFWLWYICLKKNYITFFTT